MKKLITLLAFLIPFTLFAQNSIRIVPNRSNVCENTTISVNIPGNSFFPQSYLWNTGETTQSINISTSGTYTCTVTGYGPSNFITRTYTVNKTYSVLPKPTINVVKGPWVCRFDTVILATSGGYNNYVWNNGSTSTTYTSVRDSIYGTSQLDTTSVWYTASIPNTCTVNSDTVVIRGVRSPNGVGSFYCGKMNIRPTDSIPAGLVIDFMYPTQYEMEFTQVSNPSNVMTYFPPLGSRKAPASMLIPGEQYSVRTRVIINGWTFCWGTPCEIGVSAVAKFGGETVFPGFIEYESTASEKTFEIVNMNGQIVSINRSTTFNYEWLNGLKASTYIINVIDGRKPVESYRINKLQ